MASTDLSAFDKAAIPNACSFRFGIVVSEWNSEITHNLKKAAIETLLECGAKEEHIISWNVPGSFELVYGCKENDRDPVIGCCDRHRKCNSRRNEAF